MNIISLNKTHILLEYTTKTMTWAVLCFNVTINRMGKIILEKRLKEAGAYIRDPSTTSRSCKKKSYITYRPQIDEIYLRLLYVSTAREKLATMSAVSAQQRQQEMEDFAKSSDKFDSLLKHKQNFVDDVAIYVLEHFIFISFPVDTSDDIGALHAFYTHLLHDRKDAIGIPPHPLTGVNNFRVVEGIIPDEVALTLLEHDIIACKRDHPYDWLLRDSHKNLSHIKINGTPFSLCDMSNPRPLTTPNSTNGIFFRVAGFHSLISYFWPVIEVLHEEVNTNQCQTLPSEEKQTSIVFPLVRQPVKRLRDENPLAAHKMFRLNEIDCGNNSSSSPPVSY